MWQRADRRAWFSGSFIAIRGGVPGVFRAELPGRCLTRSAPLHGSRILVNNRPDVLIVFLATRTDSSISFWCTSIRVMFRRYGNNARSTIKVSFKRLTIALIVQTDSLSFTRGSRVSRSIYAVPKTIQKGIGSILFIFPHINSYSDYRLCYYFCRIYYIQCSSVCGNKKNWK